MSIYTTYKDCKRDIFFNAMLNPTSIDIIDSKEGFDSVDYQYSYSFDNATWSAWETNKANFLTELSLANQFNAQCYVKIRITISSSAKQTFACYQLVSITFSSIQVKPSSITIVTDNNIINNERTKNILNPYRQSEAQKTLYDKLSRTASDIFGFECMYFRTEPSKPNITFKTYNLSQVIEQKMLKVVIRGNEIPDNKLRFSEFDIDFQDELELHIVKSVFEEVFGIGKEPNGNDYLWLPLTNHMYQINTVYPAKTFMQHAPFYKAILVKYENRANVVTDSNTDSIIDEFISYETDFEKELTLAEIENAEKSFNQPKIDAISDNYISDNKQEGDSNISFRWSYDWSSKTNQTVTKQYVLQRDKHQFTIVLWFSVANLSNKIFDLTDSINRTVMSCSVQNQQIAVDISTDNQQIVLTTETVEDIELIVSQFYGLVINYAYEANTKLITVSLVDSTYTVIREIAISNEKILSLPNSLKLYGANKYAAIRVKNTFVKRSDTVSELSNELPETFNYQIIDNATPSLEEPGSNC